MSALIKLYEAGIIPQFLDRSIKPDGTRMTRDDVDVLRARLHKAHGTLRIKSPKLHGPRRRAKATGLGVAVGEIKVGKGA